MSALSFFMMFKHPQMYEIMRENCEDRCNVESLLTALSTPPAFSTVRINSLCQSLQSAKEQLLTLMNEQYSARGWTLPTIYLHSQMSDVIVIENSGPHDLSQIDSKKVIVDLACGMAVLRGADVYAQGVMGASAAMQAGDAVSVYADVTNKCLKGFTGDFTGPLVFVGNGIARKSRSQLFVVSGSELPSGVAVEMTSPLYRCPSLNGLDARIAYAQNLPSIVCGHVLDPQPGDTVLDMCAAPGGKTTHLGMLMKDQGVLIALDKNTNKMRRVQETCCQHNLLATRVYAFDACKAVSDSDGLNLEGPPPYPPHSFDRILLDAPCSALGQRPSVYCSLSVNDVQSYPKLQRKLFDTAVRLLKPGGVLVYSTCTVMTAENEDLVHWALQRHSCLRLAVQSPHVGGRGWPCTGLSDEQRHLVQRFDPASLVDSQGRGVCGTVDTDAIGFFIAKFVKV